MKIKTVTRYLLLFSIFCLIGFNNVFAQKKAMAITIDDLPFVGEYRNFHLNMMMNTMKDETVPATGFIIAKEVRPDNWEMLHKFRDAGFGLGNHTFSHANLNKLKAKEYIQEIKEADSLLMSVLTEPKYFRYPYLAMSSGNKKIKSSVILKNITIVLPRLLLTAKILSLINAYYLSLNWEGELIWMS